MSGIYSKIHGNTNCSIRPGTKMLSLNLNFGVEYFAVFFVNTRIFYRTGMFPL